MAHIRQSFTCVVALLATLLHPPLCRSASTDTVDAVSHEMTSFVEQLSDVKCSEKVTQTKFSKDGRTEYSEESTYDYLVLLQANDDELLLNESRLVAKEPNNRVRKNVPLLITNGFSNLMLIFHPYYRNSFSFELLNNETVGGTALARVHFAHIQGTRTPVGLSVRGREFPLSLQGTAWIDTQTGMIARIETSLEHDMSDVGLKSLVVTVEYEPVRLPGWTQAYRFPSVATIDVETLQQRWRNVHRFTNYQRFMVDTDSTVAAQAAR